MSSPMVRVRLHCHPSQPAQPVAPKRMPMIRGCRRAALLQLVNILTGRQRNGRVTGTIWVGLWPTGRTAADLVLLGEVSQLLLACQSSC